MEGDKTFAQQYADKIKQSMLDGWGDHHELKMESMKNWRSWGSWFSWGSPVGLSIFFIALAICDVLAHYAQAIGH